MEFCDDGDLAKKIQDRATENAQKNVENYFSEEKILMWFTMMCLGLKHCHDRRIIHRDVKAQNVFMCKNGMLKLGDFGQSSVLANTRAMVETFQGTPYYVAPELFQEQPYSFPSDVWSLGVLLYEMCCLKYPFMPNGEKSDVCDLGRLVMKAEPDTLPSCYSEKLKVLIKHLLKKDPKKRPTVN